MSGEGRESIPTSADPRSRRPTKKRALTPVSAQAASVDALFSKPDQDIRIPPSGAGHALAARRAAPPEIVTNVQGSSAGAGSGEFHVYKASRRREYERLREMDDQVRAEKGQEEFEKDRAERLRRDDEKTKKNREKREKMKARKSKKGKGGDGGGGGGGANTSGQASSNDTTQRSLPDGDAVRHQLPRATNGDATVVSSGAQHVGLVIHDDD